MLKINIIYDYDQLKTLAPYYINNQKCYLSNKQNGTYE